MSDVVQEALDAAEHGINEAYSVMKTQLEMLGVAVPDAKNSKAWERAQARITAMEDGLAKIALARVQLGLLKKGPTDVSER